MCRHAHVPLKNICKLSTKSKVSILSVDWRNGNLLFLQRMIITFYIHYKNKDNKPLRQKTL